MVEPVKLTDRELEVARLCAQGLSTKEIAAVLSLSPHTITQYVIRVKAKLGVTHKRHIYNEMKRRKLLW